MDTVGFVLLLSGIILVQADINDMKQLIGHLIDEYNKVLAPQGPDDTALNVTFGLFLKRVVSLEGHVLTLDGSLYIKWTDQQLLWDPRKFAGVNEIWIPREYIWQPDIVLLDDVIPYIKRRTSELKAYVKYDGVVEVSTPVKLLSYCKQKKLSKKVTCSVKFSSWTYNNQYLDITPIAGDLSLSEFDNDFNEHWQVTGFSVAKKLETHIGTSDSYVLAIYDISFQHRE